MVRCLGLDRIVLFCFVLLASVRTRGAHAALRKIVLRTNRRTSYIGQTAEFGDQIGYYPTANLMLPPEGSSDLCSYPEALVNVTNAQASLNNTNGDTNGSERYPYGYPLALLVSMGGCDAGQKVRVFLEMKQNLTNELKYLFLYSIDPDDRDVLARLTTNNNDLAEKMRNVGILYFPYRSGKSMLEQVDLREEKMDGISPHLQQDNEGWVLPADIEIYYGNRPPYEPSTYSRDRGVDNFYWIRFVLFALLIVSPCLRAGYLWYRAGGRFHFRRNEQGQIVGLQYIPPMPHWLTAGRVPQQLEPVSSTLSEEQVNALPVIEYQPLEDDGGGGNVEEDIVVANDVEAGASEVPTSVAEDQDSSNASKRADVEQPAEADAPESSEDSSPVHPVETGVVRTDLTTSCTMCSICIDDFERGEHLTLLPRCQHAFHKDCIMPWLTERQGCCPLCKTNVLEDEPQTSEDSEGSVEEERDQEQEREQQR